MKPEKFSDFVAKFDAAQYSMPLLLVEQIARSESIEKVFETAPAKKAELLLIKNGRTLGSKPLENAQVFAFQTFESSVKVGISVGRADTNKLTLPDNAVSKMHASFKLNYKGEWQIVDVESENGTLVKGQKIEANKSVVLNSGDGITFADTYHCTFFSVEDFQTYLESISLK